MYVERRNVPSQGARGEEERMAEMALRVVAGEDKVRRCRVLVLLVVRLFAIGFLKFVCVFWVRLVLVFFASLVFTLEARYQY